MADDDRAAAAATAAATETLLNCYIREADGWRVDGEALTIPVRGGDATVVADLRYRSSTFRHRYVMPVGLAVGAGAATPVGFATLAGLLLEELDGPGTQPVTLLARMVESLQNVAGFLAARGDDVDRLWAADPLGFVE